MSYCSDCGKILKEYHVGHLCYECFIDKEKEKQQDWPILKVKFFGGTNLVDIENHMNKFFEQEKITKDNLVNEDIKYTMIDSEWGTKYSVMVVYHI